MKCGVTALVQFALACFAEDVGRLTDTRVIKVESSETAKVIDAIVEEVDFEAAWAGGVVEDQERDC